MANYSRSVKVSLWSRNLIEQCRIKRGDQPDMQRIVIAVDPPGGMRKANAECGIVIGGLGRDRHGYVLADLSGRYSPEGWARRVVDAYHGYRADKIVAEQNFGGAMVESTLRSVDPNVPIKMVVASRGKQLRAEPIASLFEQHRLHLVGAFDAVGGPDVRYGIRRKAAHRQIAWTPCVYTLTELMGGPPPMQINPAAIEQMRNRWRRYA